MISSTTVKSSRLSDSGNYHEFCRLFTHYKSNYQLGKVKEFSTISVIARVKRLTISLRHKPYLRRFTSTVPARGARAPNRAISNSCL